MTRLRKSSILCPSCDEKFSADIIFSTIWSGKVSTDLLRFSMGSRVPVHYLVYTCPHCGWSGQEEHPEPVSPEIRRFISENITPGLEKPDIPSWRKWEYHALISQAAGCSHLEIGSSYLIAAQCARLGEKYEEEKHYRLKSVDQYLMAMEKEVVPEGSLYQTTYIIGELYRRVGDKWKSNEWFQKVLDINLEHERREFFVNLARQQMSAPRNFVEEEDEREAAKLEKPGLLSKMKKLLGIGEVRY
jgi:uncharacterized protein (DUF2225 family)